MSPETRPSFYTLRTTDGHQATIYVPPDDDPWQAATQHARASFAADSQLAELRIASEAEIAAFQAQRAGAPLAPAQPSEPGSGAPSLARSDPSPAPNQPARGAKVNAGPPGCKSTDHPAWATSPQQETWRTAALVIWDHDLRRIVGLWAGEAVGLLAYMRSDSAWQIDGIQVGPSSKFARLGDPHWEPTTATRDHIPFDAADALQLLNLLQQNEQILRQMAQDDQRQAHKALGQVYTLLIDAAKRAQARRAQEVETPQAEPGQP